MPQHLAAVAILVPDYDAAIAFYVGKLGFELIEDTPQSPTKRWVMVAPPGSKEARLLLAKAATPDQAAHIGSQTGGRVFLFLHTDDFERDYRAMRDNGIRFVEQPRHEDYGKVVVFTDPFGNKWDLVQPAAPRPR